ncbi:MAG: pyruvate, water dikinase [Thermoleophilaceae bacterium]|nr:pyruvate, water dikinase [Thermoleophilaceae bacterium]
MHTRPLADLRSCDEALFGGKSASLGELIGAGIPVPPGFALASSAFEAAGFAARDDARAAVRAAAIPDDVRAEVSEAYAGVGDGDPPVAVRSSAIGEDSAEATFAGQQDTYLWVRGADRVCEAVRDCWASLFNPEAISYRARLGGDRPPAMGVTVQLMVDAKVSGVMFTCNPLTGDPSTVAINASWGLGLAVVGGEVTPDEYRVSKVTREVLRTTIGPKQVEYVPGEAGAERSQVPAERQDVACLDEEQLRALVEVGALVERHFGGHQDIEWAFAGDGELFVLQSRPVTVAPPQAQPAAKSAMDLVMGTFGVGKKP